MVGMTSIRRTRLAILRPAGSRPLPRGHAHPARVAQAVDGIEHPSPVIGVEEADVFVGREVGVVDVVGVVEDEETLPTMAPEPASRAPLLPTHGVEVEALAEAAHRV